MAFESADGLIRTLTCLTHPKASIRLTDGAHVPDLSARNSKFYNNLNHCNIKEIHPGSWLNIYYKNQAQYDVQATDPFIVYILGTK